MTPTKYLIYDATGAILRTGSTTSTDIALKAGAGEYAIESEPYPPETHYVVDGRPVERPACPGYLERDPVAANDIDVARISGIPAGALVTVVETEQSAYNNATFIEFTFDTPGTYTVTVEAFPYLDGEFTIHAT